MEGRKPVPPLDLGEDSDSDAEDTKKKSGAAVKRSWIGGDRPGKRLTVSTEPPACGRGTPKYRARIMNTYMQYVTPAARAVNIVLDDDQHNQVSFKPEFCHQVFTSCMDNDDDSLLVGYRDLSIRITYHAAHLWSMYSISCTSKLDALADPDELHGPVQQVLGDSLCATPELYSERTARRFQPFGTMFDEFKHADMQMRLYLWKLDTPEAQAYHRRMESMVIWFIETASAVDVTDHRWHVLGMYRVHPGENGGPESLSFVGYTSCFIFTQPLRPVRPQVLKICQSLVLPCYQRLGLGAVMLRSVMRLADVSDVFQVTVEDPCPAFSALRLFVDVERCVKAGCLATSIAENSVEVPESALIRLREDLRITPTQASMVAETLLYAKVPIGDDSADGLMTKYRLAVKKRLMNTFPDVKALPVEERKSRLAVLYSEHIELYHRICQKLRLFGGL